MREPIDPTPNHEPGTSISTVRLTCSWPGYCLTNSIYLPSLWTSSSNPPARPRRRCLDAAPSPLPFRPPSCRVFKGGPQPLENKINKKLGLKREDRFSDQLFPIWYKISVWFVFRTCLASTFSVRPRGTCESSRRSARR